MAQYIQVASPTGEELLIEVADPRPGTQGIQKAGLGQILYKVEAESRASLENAINAAISLTAGTFHDAVCQLQNRPDELEVAFGLKITGEAGLPIAVGKISADTSYSIKLVWKAINGQVSDAAESEK